MKLFSPRAENNPHFTPFYLISPFFVTKRRLENQNSLFLRRIREIAKETKLMIIEIYLFPAQAATVTTLLLLDTCQFRGECSLSLIIMGSARSLLCFSPLTNCHQSFISVHFHFSIFQASRSRFRDSEKEKRNF